MKPLLVLLGIFSIGMIIKSLLKRKRPSSLQIARWAMGCMLLFTGAAHFAYTEGMAEMLADWIPFRMCLVYITGILEVIGAIGLMISSSSKITGICLMLFLLLVFPANIYAAIHNIDPITGMADGHGIEYLFFRVPLQLFFILWIYISAVKPHIVKSKLESYT